MGHGCDATGIDVYNHVLQFRLFEPDELDAHVRRCLCDDPCGLEPDPDNVQPFDKILEHSCKSEEEKERKKNCSHFQMQLCQLIFSIT